MNPYNSSYDYKDFQKIFEDKSKLKACSMNIFKKSHIFTYEQYMKRSKMPFYIKLLDRRLYPLSILHFS